MKQYFINDNNFPVVLSPSSENFDLVAWAEESRPHIRQLLNKHGAILFRGFNLPNITEFENFSSQATDGDWVDYKEASSPRSQIKGKVFTSTEYDKRHVIFQHNENSHVSSWPLYLFFYCKTPPESGGETPITDCRKVYEDIPEEIKSKFKEKNILYVRKFGYGMGIPWKQGFPVSNKSEMVEYCLENKMNALWEEDEEKLELRYKRWASLQHPITKEHVWFNHGTFFNNQMLSPEIREILIESYGEKNLPYNTYFGDGSIISKNIIDGLREAYEKNTVQFSYEKNDVLMVDNMLVAHGRKAYDGEREVCVAMSENVSYTQFETDIVVS